jgi:hypothetical protein
MPTARHNISKRSSSTDESCLPKRFVDPTNRTIDLIWLPRMQTDAVGDLGFPEISHCFSFIRVGYLAPTVKGIWVYKLAWTAERFDGLAHIAWMENSLDIGIV